MKNHPRGGAIGKLAHTHTHTHTHTLHLKEARSAIGQKLGLWECQHVRIKGQLYQIFQQICFSRMCERRSIPLGQYHSASVKNAMYTRHDLLVGTPISWTQWMFGVPCRLEAMHLKVVCQGLCCMKGRLMDF